MKKLIEKQIITEDNVVFKNVSYKDCLFKDIDLSKKVFNNINFYNCEFDNAYLAGSVLFNSSFESCRLNDSDLSYATFLDSDFTTTVAKKSNFFNSKFSNITNIDTYFIDCNMNFSKLDELNTNKPMLINCADKLSDFQNSEYILKSCGRPCGWHYSLDGTIDKKLQPYQLSAIPTKDIPKLSLESENNIIYKKDFSHQNITKLDMNNKIYINCKFNDAVSFNKNIQNTAFVNCELKNIGFTNAVLDNCNIDGCIMTSSNFYGATFLNTNVFNSDIDFSNFSTSKHYNSMFYKNSMKECSLSFLKEGKMTILESDIIDSRTSYIAPKTLVIDESTYYSNINKDHSLSEIDKVSKEFRQITADNFETQTYNLKDDIIEKVM